MPRVVEIVLTGGPCAGKTSALAYLSEKITEKGWLVFTIPETATLISQGGALNLGELAGQDHDAYLIVEREMVLLHLQMRQRWIAIARATAKAKGKNAVLLGDRGIMDFQAYLSKTEFADILTFAKTDLAHARDSYDLVIHLVSAANGAEGAYTVSNNNTRHETIEVARELDKTTLDCWMGRQPLAVVGNDTPFDGKLLKALALCLDVMGERPMAIERKFLLQGVPQFPQGTIRVDIEQIYLNAPAAEEIYIRKRSQDGHKSYRLAQKRRMGNEQIKTSRLISSREYRDLREQATWGLKPIYKKRYCLVYSNRHFIVDVYPGGQAILEYEEEGPPRLPTWIEVDKEVTGQKEYLNRSLAEKGFQPTIPGV